MMSVSIFDVSEEGNFEYVASMIPILQVRALSAFLSGQGTGIGEFVLRRNAT